MLAYRLIVVERHVSGTKLNRPELMRLLATA
jgi:DNA invertase Pin-like site-specific DNA recombinase